MSSGQIGQSRGDHRAFALKHSAPGPKSSTTLDPDEEEEESGGGSTIKKACPFLSGKHWRDGWNKCAPRDPPVSQRKHFLQPKGRCGGGGGPPTTMLDHAPLGKMKLFLKKSYGFKMVEKPVVEEPVVEDVEWHECVDSPEEHWQDCLEALKEEGGLDLFAEETLHGSTAHKSRGGRLLGGTRTGSPGSPSDSCMGAQLWAEEEGEQGVAYMSIATHLSRHQASLDEAMANDAASASRGASDEALSSADLLEIPAGAASPESRDEALPAAAMLEIPAGAAIPDPRDEALAPEAIVEAPAEDAIVAPGDEALDDGVMLDPSAVAANPALSDEALAPAAMGELPAEDAALAHQLARREAGVPDEEEVDAPDRLPETFTLDTDPAQGLECPCERCNKVFTKWVSLLGHLNHRGRGHDIDVADLNHLILYTKGAQEKAERQHSRRHANVEEKKRKELEDLQSAPKLSYYQSRKLKRLQQELGSSCGAFVQPPPASPQLAPGASSSRSAMPTPADAPAPGASTSSAIVPPPGGDVVSLSGGSTALESHGGSADDHPRQSAAQFLMDAILEMGRKVDEIQSFTAQRKAADDWDKTLPKVAIKGKLAEVCKNPPKAKGEDGCKRSIYPPELDEEEYQEVVEEFEQWLEQYKQKKVDNLGRYVLNSRRVLGLLYLQSHPEGESVTWAHPLALVAMQRSGVLQELIGSPLFHAKYTWSSCCMEALRAYVEWCQRSILEATLADAKTS